MKVRGHSRARKVWRQLNHEGIGVARCTVEHVMAEMGPTGAVRDTPAKKMRSA